MEVEGDISRPYLSLYLRSINLQRNFSNLLFVHWAVLKYLRKRSTYPPPPQYFADNQYNTYNSY